MKKTTEKLKKEIFQGSDIEPEGLPEKQAERALYLRRKLEDHHMAKKLNISCGDEYWVALDDVS